jgi:hypothetical protein
MAREKVEGGLAMKTGCGAGKAMLGNGSVSYAKIKQTKEGVKSGRPPRCIGDGLRME